MQVFLLLSFMSIFILQGLSTPPLTQAQSQLGLSVVPAIIPIKINAPGVLQRVISLTNTTNDEEVITIEVRPIQISSDGTVKLLSENDSSQDEFAGFAQKIHFEIDNIATDTLLLGAKEKKDVTLSILIDENVKASDYYFSVLFNTSRERENTLITDTSQSHAFTDVSVSIATHILLSVNQADTSRVTIHDFKTESVYTEGPVQFSGMIRNSGNQFMIVTGDILIENLFGQKIGKIALASFPIPAGSQRELKGEVNQFISKSIKALPTWEEKFLLGRYTATLSLSEPGQERQRNISQAQTTFYALPTSLLLILAFIAALVIFGMYRFKRLASRH